MIYTWNPTAEIAEGMRELGLGAVLVFEMTPRGEVSQGINLGNDLMANGWQVSADSMHLLF